MIIKLILLAGLIGTFGYALSQHRRSRWLSTVLMVISVAGAVFVLLPNLTNEIANAVGVGRGADLVLYCFVLISLFAIFNIHLRLRASAGTTTELARALAIMSAIVPQAGRLPGYAGGKEVRPQEL